MRDKSRSESVGKGVGRASESGDSGLFAVGEGHSAGDSPAVLVDAGDRHILDANPRAVTLLGGAAAELVGKAFPEIVEPHRAEDGADGGRGPASFRLAGADGESALYGITSASFVLKGRPVVLHIFYDVTEWANLKTELTDLNLELSHLARHDHLTNLFNRLMFQDTLELANARLGRLDGCLGVLYIDLDGFKQVNDRLGHDAGDHVLVEVASRLRGAVRTSDVAARLGGDEFGVILENLRSPEDALKVARQIIARVSEPISTADEAIQISASIGAAVTDRPLPDVATLVTGADTMMFEAKSGGRGRAALTADIGRRRMDQPVA